MLAALAWSYRPRPDPMKPVTIDVVCSRRRKCCQNDLLICIEDYIHDVIIFIYGFKQRVDNSLNKVVNTVANTSLLSSKLRKHWRTVLYILPVA